MTQRSTVHATFVIERILTASPARVFEAWAVAAAKSRWFGPASLPSAGYTLAFEVGGHERFKAAGPDGALYGYDARYADIVDGERIVYAYDMYRDETRISVSLATVEFAQADGGTRLTFTEQGVFLDGHDTPALREHGTGELLDSLAAALEGGNDS
jgi:uncharacterized protein YndB with AHSA1/START domain